MEIVRGNITDATEAFILQQVNHKGVMGSGVAKALRDKHPGVIKGYQLYCKRYSWDYVKAKGMIHVYQTDNKVCVMKPNYENMKRSTTHCCYQKIINIFGQENYGRDGKTYTDYQALYKGLVLARDYIKNYNNTNDTVAIPYGIGCGLGGGNWKIVEELLEELFPDAVLYKYGG